MLRAQPNLRHLNLEAASLGLVAAGAVATAVAAACPNLAGRSTSPQCLVCEVTVGGISYCIQYLARLALGQKSKTIFGNIPKKSLT